MKKKGLLSILFLLLGSLSITSCDLGGGKDPDPIVDNELTTYKNTKKSSFVSAFNENNYTGDELTLFKSYIDSCKTAIDNATSKSEVDNAITSFTNLINSLQTKQQKNLATAKTNAKSTLENYVNFANYDNDDQTTINDYISAAKTEIESATSESDINNIVSECKTKIDAIETTAEKQDLANYKTQKKAEINSYKTMSNYRTAEKDTLAGYISGCETEIDESTSKASVDSALSKYKALMDKVKTDAELTKEEQESVDKYFSVYAINDFHGSVLEDGDEQGILKVASYLKEKKKEDNTLLINSGDMFQGAIESNYNRGELLTKIMNDVQFDCMTIGNHEFDWGTTYIKQNYNLKDETTNYSTPFLGANIYYCDSNFKATTHASDLCQEYVIRELDNGLRVGIIGVIGEDQITSINADYVSNITFVDPTPICKTLSDKLRTEEDCDVVIVDTHASVEQAISGSASYEITSSSEDSEGLSSVSSVSKKKYADIVLCAHSHQAQNYTFNGTPFLQSQGNGKGITNVEVKFTKDKEVEIVSTNNALKTGTVTYDSSIKALYDTYKAQSDVVGNVYLNTLSGSTMSQYTGNTANVPNLVCKSIAYYCKDKGIDIDYAMCNNGRDPLSTGRVDYGTLFKSVPFDNYVYVIKVKGYQIVNEANYNIAVYSVNTNAINNNTYYYVAVLDYLANHTNGNRVLNYFSSQTGTPVILEDNYRDITAWFVKKLKTFSSDDYNTSKNNRYKVRTSSSSFTYTDDTPIFKDGTETDPTEETITTKTVSEINDILDTISSGSTKTYTDPIYVTGTIKSIANTTHGNLYLTDRKEDLFIYGLKDYATGNVRFDGLTVKPKVGDTVVIAIDELYQYKKDSTTTPEVNKGRLYSINGVVCE